MGRLNVASFQVCRVVGDVWYAQELLALTDCFCVNKKGAPSWFENMFSKAYGKRIYKKTPNNLETKNGTGEVVNHVVQSEQCERTGTLRNRLATAALPLGAWAAYSKPVRSERSHVLTASLHLTATLFGLGRQSPAS